MRGAALEELTNRIGFAELTHLLWDGFFDGLPSPQELDARLGVARTEVFGAWSQDERSPPSRRSKPSGLSQLA